ncbi:CrcB family protein [Saccharothrix sp. HUAS TT1]|uniref:fluoride efflux transporter FluC n=1 Tax=unclassified Saccharothrix TaxID=2593673 RepID=UPI00345B84EC
MTVLLVFVGAAVGAVLRYATGRLLRRSFPWATLVVNALGSFVLGCVAGASPDLVALLGTGLCGGLTTYSAFGYETIKLAEDGEHRQAFANVVTSVAVGVGAAALGYALTR